MVGKYFLLQHEDYVDFRDRDVALLYVDGEVEADGVTVDFATLAETDAEDFVGSDCEIAGWGQTESERFYFSCQLEIVLVRP